MKTKKFSEYERFMALTDAQRDAEVAQFDKEDLHPGHPLTPAERRQFNRIVKRGRPKVGLGAEKIRVSMERGLLAEADRLAHKLHITRSELIARGVRTVLVAQGA